MSTSNNSLSRTAKQQRKEEQQVNEDLCFFCKSRVATCCIPADWQNPEKTLGLCQECKDWMDKLLEEIDPVLSGTFPEFYPHVN